MVYGKVFRQQRLQLNFASKETLNDELLEIKRVVKKRSCKRGLPVKMWPHPCDVRQAMEDGTEPSIISTFDNQFNDADLVKFQRDHPSVEGARLDWWCPGGGKTLTKADDQSIPEDDEGAPSTPNIRATAMGGRDGKVSQKVPLMN